MQNIKNILDYLSDDTTKNFKNIEILRDLEFQSVIIKSIIIGIYSNWEKSIKDIMYDSFLKYNEHITNDDFIKKYVETAVTNNYTKVNLIETISDGKIVVTKESFTHSNNLKFSEIFKMLKFFNIESNSLKTYLENDYLQISTLVKNLEIQGVIGNSLEKEISQYNKIEGYITLLVDRRNEISHSYIMSERYTLSQLNALTTFVDNLIIEIENFVHGKLSFMISKSNREIMYKNNSYNGMNVEIYCGNTLSDKAVIIGIMNFTVLEIDNVELIVKLNGMFYPIKIIEYRNHPIGVSFKAEIPIKIKQDFEMQILNLGSGLVSITE